jgi:hypothetical protein
VRRPSKLAAVLVACVAMASLASISAAKSKSVLGSFKTPSGNIICVYSYGGGVTENIECGIKSGLKPPPAHVNCHGAGDFTNQRISLRATGRASYVTCAGDPGPFASQNSAHVLNYGKKWSHGPISCSSATNGLTCTNKSGHGFFLSRAHSRRF